MRIRTFQADSVPAAIRLVRASLGPDASVLHIRERKLKKQLGLVTRRVFEVDASCDIVVPSHFADTALDDAELPDEYELSNEVGREPTNHRIKLFEADDTLAETPARQGQHSEIQQGQNSGSSRLSSASRGGERNAKLTQTAFALLAELVDRGADSKLAKDYLGQAISHCPPGQEQDEWLLRVGLTEAIAKHIKTGMAIEADPEEPTVVAFIGPSGAGKSSGLSKLAWELYSVTQCQIGILIAMDQIRHGAVEQLLEFADQISAMVEVVSSAAQVDAAMTRMRECDLIVVDTASASNQEQMTSLCEYLDAIQPDSTQLVVSASSSARFAKETIQSHRQASPNELFITKIDEAVDFGSWLKLLTSDTLPISYIAEGPSSTGKLAEADGRKLASLVVGIAEESDRVHESLSRENARAA